MVAPSPQTDDSVDLSEYLAVVSRRKWLIFAFTAIFTGLALAYSLTATPVYTGLTEILLEPPTSSSGLRPDQLVSLETEARVLTSAKVAEIADAELRSGLTIPKLLERVSAKTSPDTLVLDISFSAPNAVDAAEGANQFAAAYLEFKQEQAQDVLDNQRKLIDAQRAAVRKDLSDAQDTLDGLSPEDPRFETAQQDVQTLQDNLDLLDLQKLQIPPVPDPAGTVILPATPPGHPSSPNHKLNLAMGLMIGLFLGIVVAFARDRIDDKVGDRADLENLLTVLATIPRATIVGGDRSVLVTESQPRSPAAEAYRSLRTSVMAMRRQSGDSVFAIASPVLGDGKSTTAANLAAALSHADKRVLVISADLRRPSLHRFFGLNNDVGLSEVLLGEARFPDALQTVSPNLKILTSGSPPARPAEILQSQAMRELIRRERERYDFILIDCPPVLGIADMVTVAPFVDATIMVARAEKTKRSLVIESMDSLAQVGAVVGGAVINDVPTSRGTYSYGYGPDADAGRFRRKRDRRGKGRSRRSKAPKPPKGSKASKNAKPPKGSKGSKGTTTPLKPATRARGDDQGRSASGAKPPDRSGA